MKQRSQAQSEGSSVESKVLDSEAGDLDQNIEQQANFGVDIQRFAYRAGNQPLNRNQVIGTPTNASATVPRSRKRSTADQSLLVKSESKTSTRASGEARATLPTPPPRPRKRKSGLSEENEGLPEAAKRRSTTKERSANDPYNPVNNLVDSLRPGLMLVMIGLNPGLNTAATGHSYSHPSNLFWKMMHWSGVTPILHQPKDTYALPDLYGIGNTNLCPRPTRSGDGLTKEEQEQGVEVIDRKVATFKPEAVCIVGKGIWDVIYRVKTGRPLKKGEFQYGWQAENLWLGQSAANGDVDGGSWKGARTFVASTTSGLAASMTPAEKLATWKPLGDWLALRRAEGVGKAK